MNNLKTFLGNRIKPFLQKRNIKNIKTSFSLSKEPDKEFNFTKVLLYDEVNTKTSFTYKDNTWNYIKYIGDFMWNELFTNFPLIKKRLDHISDNYCEITKVQYSPNKIKCYSPGEKNDWIFLKYNHDLNGSFLLSFDAKISTVNSEFQFAFNYKDIGTRYRFNLKNNKTLSFDVVEKGCFVNNIYSENLTLQLDSYHNFQIILKDAYYQYKVDDKIIMTINEILPKQIGKDFVFILWDSSGNSIDVTYKNIKVFKL